MLPDDDDALLEGAGIVPPDDPAAGLFAGDSWLRRVSGDPAIVFGGGRALLLEVAHPLVAAGVARHSDFRRDPFGRLQRTLQAMGAIVFRDRTAALAAVRGIDRAHGRVAGQLEQTVGKFPAGTAYRAHDPELMRWVWATLLDTALVVYQRFVEPLSGEALAAYHRDQAALARLLGVPEKLVPDRPEDFRRLVDETLADGTLCVGDDARAIARSVLEAPTGPWGETAGLLTAGLLPQPLRRDFGLPWDESREQALQELEVRVRAARRAAGTPVDAGREAR